MRALYKWKMHKRNVKLNIVCTCLSDSIRHFYGRWCGSRGGICAILTRTVESVQLLWSNIGPFKGNTFENRPYERNLWRPSSTERFMSSRSFVRLRRQIFLSYVCLSYNGIMNIVQTTRVPLTLCCISQPEGSHNK